MNSHGPLLHLQLFTLKEAFLAGSLCWWSVWKRTERSRATECGCWPVSEWPSETTAYKSFEEANGQKIQRAHHQCFTKAGAARRKCKSYHHQIQNPNILLYLLLSKGGNKSHAASLGAACGHLGCLSVQFILTHSTIHSWTLLQEPMSNSEESSYKKLSTEN